MRDGPLVMGDWMPHVEFDVSAGRDGHIVLRVSGEIDMSAKSLFRERLADVIEANDDDVVVDLANVGFIDSTGLALLLDARQQLEAAGRTLLIARPSPRVTRALEVAGLDVLFENQG